MIERWADTSALLHQEGLIDPVKPIAISPLTLSELEHIKDNEKESQKVQYLAREAVRTIITGGKIDVIPTDNRAIDKMIKKYHFLSNINDHRIICEAELVAERQNHDIIFLTSDALQYEFASQMPHLDVVYPMGEELTFKKEEDWAGWSKQYPNEQEMAMLYSDPKMNIFQCPINEYIKVYESKELKDIQVWTGQEYRPLKYKEMRNPYIGEVLRPRNPEQRMAFDLLQNSNIRVKLLTSAWGGGKTLMALTYALEKIYHEDYKKLIFVRNNIVVADTHDIGFLPGDLRDKMSIWGGPIADHLGGQEVLDDLIDRGIIEIFPLSHIRGRSIKDAIVICDECENMNDKLVTLLMSRIEDEGNSELIFCGDVAQIDNKKFEKNNGIRSMLTNLKGEPLFGTVKLIKSERGVVAALCDKMIPPT